MARQLRNSILEICCYVCVLLLLVGITLFTSFDSTVLATNSSTVQIGLELGIPISMISTRNNSDYVSVGGSAYGNAYNFSDITKLFESCPDEFVTFVPGWGNDDMLVKERLDRVKLSLEKNNYS